MTDWQIPFLFPLDFGMDPTVILDRFSSVSMSARVAQVVLITTSLILSGWVGGRLQRLAVSMGEETQWWRGFAGQLCQSLVLVLLLATCVSGAEISGHRTDAWWLDHALSIAIAIAGVRLIGWVLRFVMQPHDLLAFTLWLLEWAVVIALALAFLGLLRPLLVAISLIRFEVGAQVFKGQNIIGGVLLAATAFTLATQLARLIESGISFYSRLQPLDKNHGTLLSRLLAVTLFTFTGVGVLVAAGVEGSTLAAFAGALGLGLGFGLQDVVTNFIAGLYILVERAMKEGDYVTINGIRGRVTKLTSRAIVIRDAVGTESLIPNIHVTKGVLQNHTLSNDDYRVSFQLRIASVQEFEKVRHLILEVLRAHPRTLNDKPQRALITSLHSDVVTLEISCWINDLQNSTSELISDLSHDIAQAFLLHHIDLARCPQE